MGFRHRIAQVSSSRTAGTPLRSVAEMTPPCDAEEVVGSVSSGGSIRQAMPVSLREILQSPVIRALRSPTTRPGHPSPAPLQAAEMSWNRHQPASKVAVLADLRGGDAVAENCPSELIDALAVRSYAAQSMTLRVRYVPGVTAEPEIGANRRPGT